MTPVQCLVFSAIVIIVIVIIVAHVKDSNEIFLANMFIKVVLITIT